MITTVTIITILVGVCAGFDVGPVRLTNGSTYIPYTDPPRAGSAILECPYTDARGEVVSRIAWTLWKEGKEEGTFVWQPLTTTQATGLLEGVVNLDRQDGSLELSKLRYDLAGYYSCAVTLYNGQVKAAEKWELIILDITSAHTSGGSSANMSQCLFINTFKSFAIYPPPTVHSGLYAESRGGYYDELPPDQWSKTVYPNMSTAYEYVEKGFKINKYTPPDAELRTSVGVTKKDGTYINLFTSKPADPVLTDRGCPEVAVEEGEEVRYSGVIKTCRQEYKPYYGQEGQAVVRCKDGWRAGVNTSSLSFTCHQSNLTWTPDLNPDYLRTLECVGSGCTASLSSLTITLLSYTLLSLLLH